MKDLPKPLPFKFFIIAGDMRTYEEFRRMLGVLNPNEAPYVSDGYRLYGVPNQVPVLMCGYGNSRTYRIVDEARHMGFNVLFVLDR